jgi:predicted dehydrogenase
MQGEWIMSDPIGVGVIGAGILGRRHARVFAEIPETTVAAVADTVSERAEKTATEVGARFYTDYRALLGDPAVSIVSIATPDHLHFEPVMAALAAGKHVLVEKPLATSAREARDMVAEAERLGLILQVNYSQRFVPENAWAKNEIERGGIGDLLISRSVANDTISVPTEMIPWAGKSSPLFFMSSHHLDLICWYAASGVQEVFAYETSGVLRSRGIDTHDAVEALLRFTNGTTAALHSAWIYPNSYPSVSDSYLELIGSSGVIQLGRGDSAQAYSSSSSQRVKLATAYEVAGVLHGAFRDSLELFVKSVVTGSEPMTSAGRTLPVTLAQIAIMESLARQQPVKVEDCG